MLYIVRGLPGSGKSTLAKKLVNPDFHFEADMYFMKDGEYKFNPSELKEAHAWCLHEIVECMKMGKDCVVSNTFTQNWEMKPYINAATEFNVPYQVIEVHGDRSWKNTHGVPEASIQKMKSRWEKYSE